MTEALQQEIRTLRSLHNSERDPEGRVFAPLADAYRRAGQIPEAVRLLNDGLGRLPDFVPGHVVAAQLYVEQGLAEEAGFAARRALELDPDNVNALRSLLRVLEEGGEAGKAVDVREHLVEIEPDFAAEEAGRGGPTPSRPAAGPGLLEIAEEGSVGVESELEAPAAAFGVEPSDSVPGSLDEIGVSADEADALATKPTWDLADVTHEAEGSFAREPELSEASVAPSLEALEPDPEPVFDLDALTVTEEDSADADVSDIGLLPAEESEEAAVDRVGLPEPEPVLDLGALAPYEPEEAVLEMGALAPDEPEEPVLDMAALAPDEPEEPVLDMAALAPDEPEEPVLDMGALAPDEPEEPVLDMGALAPEVHDDPIFDMGALAPDAVPSGASDDAPVDVDDPSPGEPDGIVIDLDALRPSTAEGVTEQEEPSPTDDSGGEDERPDWLIMPESAGAAAADESDGEPAHTEEHGDAAAPPAGSDDETGEDEDATGELVYTRTLAELYVKQGAVARALGVLRHLLAEDPGNRDLADRIAQLEEGVDAAPAAAEAASPRDRRTWQPDDAEADEEVESLARDLAASGEGEHDVDTPFAWGEREPDQSGAEGPSIRDYFDGLLSWDSEDEG